MIRFGNESMCENIPHTLRQQVGIPPVLPFQSDSLNVMCEFLCICIVWYPKLITLTDTRKFFLPLSRTLWLEWKSEVDLPGWKSLANPPLKGPTQHRHIASNTVGSIMPYKRLTSVSIACSPGASQTHLCSQRLCLQNWWHVCIIKKLITINWNTTWAGSSEFPGIHVGDWENWEMEASNAAQLPY